MGYIYPTVNKLSNCCLIWSPRSSIQSAIYILRFLVSVDFMSTD